MSPSARVSAVLTLLIVFGLLVAGVPARADEGLLTRTLMTLPARPAAAPLDGVARGHGMERESLAVALATGARLEARVSNRAGTVRISLMTDDHVTDVETLTVPADGTWRSVTATAPSAAFVRSQAWATAPVLEYRVVGQSWTMPTFRHGDDQAGFLARWQSGGSPFAVLDDAAVTILVPRVDLPALQDFSWSDFTDLDAVLEFYRHLIGTYDTWLGLSAAPSAGVHTNHTQRPFLRPDASGWGLAYYLQGAYIGTNVGSVRYYLESPSSWLILHEIGHGYDGIMTSPATASDMPLGEVWNNVYAYLYQTSVAGLHDSNWLNDAGKDAGQALRDRVRRAAGGLDFHALGHRDRLDVVARVLDATGPDGLVGFNTALRELRSAPGFSAWPSRTELIAQHWGQTRGLNLLPWFEQHSLPVNDRLRTELFDIAPEPIALPLSDIVPGAAHARTVARGLGLDSSGALVTPLTLGRADVTGSVTVRTAGDVDRRRVSLHDGATTVATATFSQGLADFGRIPAGAYTLRLPADRTTGVVPEPRWVVVQADTSTGLQITYADGQDPIGLNGTDLALLGLGDVSFASVRHDTQSRTLTLTDTLQEPHGYFTDQYARVQVSHAGQTLLDRSFIGNAARPAGTPPTVSVAAMVGTTVTITHREAGSRLVESDPRTGIAKPSLNATSVVTSYVITEHGLARTAATATARTDLVAAVRSELEFAAAAASDHPQARLEHLAAGLLAAVADLDDTAQVDALTGEFGPVLQRLLLPAAQEEAAPAPTPTPSSTISPTPTSHPAPTTTPPPAAKPTPTPTRAPSPSGVDVYSTPGLHHVNGRVWFTACEPYSRTTRCRTDIQATQVVHRAGSFIQVNGFVFNNLTYLPGMTREQWAGNPLGNKGTWTAADGRLWSTECDTAATGRGGCRSYVTATVIEAVTTPAGTAYRHVSKKIFNNMVRFRT